MKRIGIGTGLIALAFATSVQAQQAAPAAQWNVNVAEGECTLERAFTAPLPVTLSIQTLPGSDSYRLAIAGQTIPKFASGDGKTASILFLGADSRFERRANFARVGGQFGNALIFPYVERDVIDGFSGASSIAFDYGAPGVGPFAIPRARAAIKALDGCVRDQLVAWGADPVQFELGGKAPIALTPRDDWVPKPALLKMLHGGNNLHAIFRVGVSPEGMIDACDMIGKSDLDPKPACAAVLNRRLFTPAADPSGKPVRGIAAFDVKLIAVPTMR